MVSSNKPSGHYRSAPFICNMKVWLFTNHLASLAILTPTSKHLPAISCRYLNEQAGKRQLQLSFPGQVGWHCIWTIFYIKWLRTFTVSMAIYISIQDWGVLYHSTPSCLWIVMLHGATNEFLGKILAINGLVFVYGPLNPACPLGFLHPSLAFSFPFSL